MAARSEAEIYSLLVYKSPARKGGVLYSRFHSRFWSRFRIYLNRNWSLWIISGHRVLRRTAKLRCSGSTPLGASNPHFVPVHSSHSMGAFLVKRISFFARDSREKQDLRDGRLF